MMSIKRCGKPSTCPSELCPVLCSCKYSLSYTQGVKFYTHEPVFNDEVGKPYDKYKKM